MSVLSPFPSDHAVSVPCYNDCVETYSITYVLTNQDLDDALIAGWVILSSWIEPENASRDTETYLTNISFRLAKKNVRLLVVACLHITLPSETIMNVDADNPGETLGYTPSTSNELWKLRMASIAGYGPCGNVGPGLKDPLKPPKLLIVGLDIEVSTHARNGEMTLPHDDILSITISNGGWYTKEFKDICICMYTNGYVRETTWEDGRKPVIVKVKSGGHAVEMAYKVLKSINPDFVTIHNGFNYDLRYMAASCANIEGITDTFDERRLGNVGIGVFWRLPYGMMCVDTMYYAHKMENKVWNSFSLAYMSSRYNLPPKLDTDTMQLDTSKENDMTNMITYNCRDSDLHAWLAMRMKLCERVCVLAGLSRSTIWDSIANNAGKMVYCLEQSEAMRMDKWVDLSSKSGSDSEYFEGGYVLEPRPGCYKGVIVIDGNSLYGSIMVELGIFVDRCISAPTLEELLDKADLNVPGEMSGPGVDDLIEVPGLIVMRSSTKYLGIIAGGPTLLTGILKELISMRKRYKASDDEVTAGNCKVLTTSTFGVFGSKHGDISSKTCAEIITFAGRYYVKMMIGVARSCGFNVIYGDTDSIFVEVKGEDEATCMERGKIVTESIVKHTKGTVFENVGADIKGNYMSIVITSKKKYEAVMWSGEVETKGLAPVKKDTLPIVKYVMSRSLSVLNSPVTKAEMNEKLIDLLSSVMVSIKNGKLPAKSQVIEKRINGQPHYVYVDTDGNEQAVLVDVGVKVINVSKKWVVGRIKMAINRVLTCLDMNTFEELMFAHQTRMSMSKRRITA